MPASLSSTTTGGDAFVHWRVRLALSYDHHCSSQGQIYFRRKDNVYNWRICAVDGFAVRFDKNLGVSSFTL